VPRPLISITKIRSAIQIRGRLWNQSLIVASDIGKAFQRSRGFILEITAD